jgi:hypothetical protein
MSATATTGPSAAKKPKPNKITIIFVVNGDPANVEANVNAPLQAAVQKALAETENESQPLENWVVTNATGDQLDITQKVGSFDFPDGVTLIVSLKAGVLG